MNDFIEMSERIFEESKDIEREFIRKKLESIFYRLGQNRRSNELLLLLDSFIIDKCEIYISPLIRTFPLVFMIGHKFQDEIALSLIKKYLKETNENQQILMVSHIFLLLFFDSMFDYSFDFALKEGFELYEEYQSKIDKKSCENGILISVLDCMKNSDKIKEYKDDSDVFVLVNILYGLISKENVKATLSFNEKDKIGKFIDFCINQL